jgi:cobalt-zinc-cadmium efflux system protein
MSHHHAHHQHNIGNAFKIGILINVIFIAVEIYYGFFSNSVALLADAGHNFSDVIALSFSWFAIIIARRKPDMRYTYGLRRSTILAAIVNTLLLLAAVIYILLEAIVHLKSGTGIQSRSMIVVAGIGIFVNGFTAWLFMENKEHDLNIKSAFFHFIADTLVSLGVVIAGIAILFTNYYWIDPLVSLIVAIFILYSSYGLLRDSVNLALDGVPRNIDITAVHCYLAGLNNVKSIHDLHVWGLSTSETALTVHMVTNEIADNNFIPSITKHLHDNFRIGHCTIQVEQSDANPCEAPCN